ncbi:MAG: hypothetical protein J7J65_00960, partial [Candidatus Korarchaeota archaeon]|nr:hypothetical protein [Candidatus Korarchaeota archaeon]
FRASPHLLYHSPFLGGATNDTPRQMRVVHGVPGSCTLHRLPICHPKGIHVQFREVSKNS